MEKIKAYHYTNLRALRSMKRGGISGCFCYEKRLNKFKGIIPQKRFIRLDEGKELPSEAYEGIIEALLSPKPLSWTRNSKFPFLGQYLFHDLCREEDLALISFDLEKKDEAYVVERACVENFLYSEAKSLKKPTIEEKNSALRRYWESRTPVYEYRGDFCLPQLAIWSPIEFERLNIEWTLPSRTVWNNVLKETDRRYT